MLIASRALTHLAQCVTAYLTWKGVSFVYCFMTTVIHTCMCAYIHTDVYITLNLRISYLLISLNCGFCFVFRLWVSELLYNYLRFLRLMFRPLCTLCDEWMKGDKLQDTMNGFVSLLPYTFAFQLWDRIFSYSPHYIEVILWYWIFLKGESVIIHSPCIQHGNNCTHWYDSDLWKLVVLL